jgi:hypothetical protein
MDCKSLKTRARPKKAASLTLFLHGSLQTHIAFAALQLHCAPFSNKNQTIGCLLAPAVSNKNQTIGCLLPPAQVVSVS